jgi:hypothetical protein
MTKMEDIRRGSLADAERMTTAPADDNARRATLPSKAFHRNGSETPRTSPWRKRHDQAMPAAS